MEDPVNHRFLRPRLTVIPLAALGIALVCLVAAGCGASQPKQSGDENNFDSTPAGSASATAESAPKWSDKASSKEKDDDLNEAQKTQMEIALRRGGDKAANCTSVVPTAAKGEGEVKVTFNGKKGRATDVSVGPPWAGTDAESCIKRAFVGEIIVPFDGELEVPYTIKLGPKGDGDKAPKGKDKKK
jgi:hypothetical protein